MTQCSFNTALELRQRTVGRWSLSEQWVEQDGKKIQRFGSNPKELRSMAATVGSRPSLRTDLPSSHPTTRWQEQTMRTRRSGREQRPTGSWSVAEQDGAFIARIDGSTVPGWDGQSQRRSVSILGDEMKLCVAGAQIGGTACSGWKRTK